MLLSLLEATTGTAGAAGNGLSLIIIILVWVAIFYFMLIKPQKKQKKQMEELHNSMEPGDSVMTTSGFYGTILDIPDDTTVIVEFGNNKNCRIPMHKNAIAEVEKAGAGIEKDEIVDDEPAEHKKLGKEKK